MRIGMSCRYLPEEDFAIIRRSHAETLESTRQRLAESSADLLSTQGSLTEASATSARLERREKLWEKEKEGLLRLLASYDDDQQPQGIS